MRRLVIAAHLPHHRITVLVVIPQRIVTPRGFDRGGIDTDSIIASAHDNLLTPVTEEITLITRRTLGIVVGQGTRQRSNLAFAIFEDTASRILAIGIVERLLTQVAIPVDTHILGNTRFLDTANRA